MIAECDECWCGAWRRKDISEHLGAASVDDSEVTDLSTLSFDNKVPSEGYVLGALPEAGLFREGDGRFAVFVDDRWAMLMETHFDAQFAEKEAFLRG